MLAAVLLKVAVVATIVTVVAAIYGIRRERAQKLALQMAAFAVEQEARSMLATSTGSVNTIPSKPLQSAPVVSGTSSSNVAVVERFGPVHES
jgi:hypothetical protein